MATKFTIDQVIDHIGIEVKDDSTEEHSFNAVRVEVELEIEE